MDIPDPYSKTAKMTLRVIDGKLRHFSGAPLPPLPEGTIGDFIVPAYKLGRTSLSHWMQCEAVIELLPKGAELLADVRRERVPDKWKGACEELQAAVTDPWKPGRLFVRIRLNEPLRLRLRGEKPGKLVDCECCIPELKQEGVSLNHAYALVTGTFEPDRHSRGGNVFDHCFFLNKKKQQGKDLWCSLDLRRNTWKHSSRGDATSHC